MRNRILVLTIALAVLLAGALPALAAADTDAALAYLQSQQNADGGFGSGFSPDSTVGSTSDTLLAILSVGGNPADFDQDGNTPLTYLAANAASVTTAGDLAKMVLAISAAGENPRTFAGFDAVAKLESMAGADGRIGGDADTFVAHVLSVLALSGVQRPVAPAALDLIKNAQQEEGGWSWDGTDATPADTNTTAFAVQALVAAGEPAGGAVIAQALNYYQSIQNADGGWPYQNPSQYGTDTDTNSTAVVIQALVATGQDPAGADWTSAEGKTALAALEALQNDSGAFAWQAAMPDDNLLATVQALPAVAGKAFPLVTMSVGEAAAAPAAEAAPAAPAPETTPETGGAAVNLLGPLMMGGLSLLGGGYALRRKKA